MHGAAPPVAGGDTSGVTRRQSCTRGEQINGAHFLACGSPGRDRHHWRACGPLAAGRAIAETSRRLACANNLKQLGIAVASFNTANGQFPTGSVAKPYPGTPSFPQTFFRWSALTYLAPYFEQGNAVSTLDLSIPLYPPTPGGTFGSANAPGDRHGHSALALPERHSGGRR